MIVNYSPTQISLLTHPSHPCQPTNFGGRCLYHPAFHGYHPFLNPVFAEIMDILNSSFLSCDFFQEFLFDTFIIIFHLDPIPTTFLPIFSMDCDVLVLGFSILPSSLLTSISCVVYSLKPFLSKMHFYTDMNTPAAYGSVRCHSFLSLVYIPVSVGLRRWVIQCAVYLSCLCRYLSQFRGIFFNACHQGRSPACLRNLFFFKFNLPEIPRVLLIYSLEKFSSFIYYYFPSICSLFPSEAPISHIWVANLVCFFFVISTISLSYFFFTWSPMLVISSQQRPCPFQFSFWVLTTVLESFFCNLRH